MNSIKTKLKALKEGGVTVLAENAVWLCEELEEALSVIKEVYPTCAPYMECEDGWNNEDRMVRLVKRAREFLGRER